ncbi:MAG: hypothetical protein BWZ10_00084 [candidate division BRC1 bacterium ADurb.BinA364]|nr:MAG: hypothetical protein BWZ10_00084 [candidate division BRC1 bacterium ADurb.BinA364]
MLAFGPEEKRVPGEPVDIDSPIPGVLHHGAPEGDLFVDGYPADDLGAFEQPRLEHIGAAMAERFVEQFEPGAQHIVERDVGIFGHFDDRGEGMQVPQRQHVVSLPGHLVEHFAPEVHAPHFGDVFLGGVGIVRIARRAQIERDIEFDSALLDVRSALAFGQRVERAQADRLGDVESAIHRARGVGARDADRLRTGPLDPVSLRRSLA